jgi:hypothetical protein
MRRREFIAGLGAAAWPVAARAQQPAPPVVVWLDGQSQVSVQERLSAFRKGLAETGYVEGDMAQISVASYRPFGDGGGTAQHLLSSVFGTGPSGLAAAQAVFPWVDDLTPEYDYCAIQQAIDDAYVGGLCSVFLPQGRYFTTAPIFVDHPHSLRAQHAWPRWTPAANFYTKSLITGYISGTTLTVASGPALHANMYVEGGGAAWGTRIIARGGGRTYTVTPGQTVGSSGAPVRMIAQDLVIYNGLPFVALRNVRTGVAPYFQAGAMSPPYLETPPDPNWEFYYYTPANINKRGPLGQVSGIQFTLRGTPNSVGSTTLGTCINPNFTNAMGIQMGPNNGGTLENVLVNIRQAVDPVNYAAGFTLLAGVPTFGGQNPGSAGVAIAGTGAGASRTKLVNVGVTNAYTAFQVATPGGGGLADSNDFVHCVCGGCFISVSFNGSQAFINSFYDCGLSGRIGLSGPAAESAVVIEGNWGTDGEASEGNAYPIGSTSAITVTPTPVGGGFSYIFGAALYTAISSDKFTFTTTVTSGVDASLLSHSHADGRNGVYTAWTLLTANFGLVPCLAAPGAYNATTRQITLMVFPPWFDFFVGSGGASFLSTTNFEAEIRACTTLYAATMCFPFQQAIIGIGPYIESAYASQCLLSRGTSTITQLQLNYDVSIYGPSHSPTPAQLANYYTQHAFPTFFLYGGDTQLDNSISPGALNFDSIVIDVQNNTTNTLYLKNTALLPVCPRFNAGGGLFQGVTGNYETVANTIFGNTFTDLKPLNVPNNGAALSRTWPLGRGTYPQSGIKPSNSVIPSLLLTSFSILADPANLPAIAPNACNYPLIYGGSLYQTQPQGLAAGQFFCESNHQAFSWGQALTTTNIPGLSWRALGQSSHIYVDANSMVMMFFGLAFTIRTDATCLYLVTGIYPQLGYITVFNLTNNNMRVSGVKTQIYRSTDTPGTTDKFGAQPYRMRVISGPPVYTNANITAVVGQTIDVDTRAATAGRTIKLPIALVNGASPYQYGDRVILQDFAGTFGASGKQLIVDPNGGTLDDSSSPVTFSVNNSTVSIRFTGSAWKSKVT